MPKPINRREFLQCAGLVLSGVAMRPLDPGRRPSPTSQPPRAVLGRVTSRYVYARVEPDENSPRSEKIEQDVLVKILETVRSDSGPDYNPRWYKIDQGYVHSGAIQRIPNSHLNPVVHDVPSGGLVGQVTVPYTQTTYRTKEGYEMPLYRLYYCSLHRVVGLDQSRDGVPWYRLSDEWPRIDYYVPARHMHILPDREFVPISPDVPDAEKKIVVSLADQSLTAYEGGQVVLQTQVSTGKPYMDTPKGEFRVNRKTPSLHMGNGAITSKIEAYELVGVPWVSFFHTNGVAFHGTFWHDRFSTQQSRGCVNMRIHEAQWLYRWCTPVFDPAQHQAQARWRVRGEGTQVQVS